MKKYVNFGNIDKEVVCLENNSLIKMHNSIGQSRYKLNLSEQKFFIYAIMQIGQDEDNFENIKFNITDFANFVNLDIKRLYKDIDRIIENVMSLVISIKKGNGKWTKINLTQRCEYDNGHINFKFNTDMKPLLLKLHEHYFLQSPTVIKFKSWHSIRLYDLLKSVAFKQIKHNKGIFAYDLFELKSLLKLEGKYNRFNSFREKVLVPSMDEINQKSDIEFTYKKITKGRKVTGIEFIIKNNGDQKKNFDGIIDFEEIKQKSGLEKEKFNSEQLMELYEIAVKKTEGADVNPYLYISFSYKHMIKKGSARNKFTWLRDCLENDWGNAIVQIGTGYNVE